MHMHGPIRDACFCDDDDDYYYDVWVWVHVCIFHSNGWLFFMKGWLLNKQRSLHQNICSTVDSGWQMVTKFRTLCLWILLHDFYCPVSIQYSIGQCSVYISQHFAISIRTMSIILQRKIERSECMLFFSVEKIFGITLYTLAFCYSHKQMAGTIISDVHKSRNNGSNIYTYSIQIRYPVQKIDE